MDTLLSVVKFGGQGFSKIARSTLINRSPHAGLVERLQAGTISTPSSTESQVNLLGAVGGSPPDASYMDVVANLLLRYVQISDSSHPIGFDTYLSGLSVRFLQAEPKPSLAPTMRPFNISLQTTAIDLLQALIVRGEVDLTALQAMESVIISKLYFAIHTQRLDLQNKLLHLLHSIVSGLSSQVSGPSSKPTKTSSDRALENTRLSDTASSPAIYSFHPLFVQTLQDGISEPANRPLLQHWLDFVMMTVPQFQSLLASTITPLNDTICRQLRGALADIVQASTQSATSGDIIAFTTDTDFMMLLSAVERLVLLSLSNVSFVTQEEEESPVGEKQETSGLLGYVSGVFSSESGQNTIDEQAAVGESPIFVTLDLLFPG